LPAYTIPARARYTTPRPHEKDPDIIYYFTPPQKESYPIALICTGSSTKECLYSIIHIHRYFLKEFMDLGIGVITLEQWGIDGPSIDPEEFIQHYTMTQGLKDHQTMIDTLLTQPPKGWNKKFILLGISEGGVLVTNLTATYNQCVSATMNWCGPPSPWIKELWYGFGKILYQNPVCAHHISFKDCRHCNKGIQSFQAHEAFIEHIIEHPCFDEEFLGMTYAYHADAMFFPQVDFTKLEKPFLW